MFLWWPGKTVTTWLESSDSLAIFTRHGTLRFSFILVLQSSLNGKRFHPLEDYKRHLEQFFAQKDLKVLGRWDYEVWRLWRLMVSLSPPSVLCSIHLVSGHPSHFLSLTLPVRQPPSIFSELNAGSFVAFITTWHFIHLFS